MLMVMCWTPRLSSRMFIRAPWTSVCLTSPMSLALQLPRYLVVEKYLAENPLSNGHRPYVVSNVCTFERDQSRALPVLLLLLLLLLLLMLPVFLASVCVKHACPRFQHPCSDPPAQNNHPKRSVLLGCCASVSSGWDVQHTFPSVRIVATI